jgi:NAD(P)H-nitrite reductase large subunit
MACEQVGETGPSLHIVSNSDPFICRCMRVCRSTITKAIVEQKLTTVDAITEKTEAGGACTCCHRVLQKMLNEHNGERDMRVHAQMCAAPVQTP